MTVASADAMRVAVAGGAAVVEGVRSGSDVIGRAVEVRSAADDAVADCLVVDTAADVDVGRHVERWQARDDAGPVALLVADWTTDDVLDALATTDVTCLPRALVDQDPAVLCRRLVAAVESTTDRASTVAAGPSERASNRTDAAETPAEEGIDNATPAVDARRRERYGQVFDHVNDLVLVYDPWKPALVDVNASAVEVTGYDRAELLALGLDPVSATEDGYTADRAFEIQRAVAESGEPETVEWVIETAAGERRRLECTLSPATIDGEDRVLVLARDVTERYQLEQTYREVFENVSDGLVVHDPETGEILDVNERFCEMNRYERDELVGNTIDVVTDPDHGLEAAQEKIQAAREEGPQLFEWPSHRKDGSTFPAEIHLSVVDIRGAERVLASVRDVTERLRREREYQQLFDGVTEAIAIQDPETAELVDANQSFVDRLGYEDLETVLDLGFGDLSAADAGFTKEQAQALCQRVMASGESETVEWQQETAEGETVYIEATVSTAVINGEDRVVSMQRDVTEQRLSERRLRAIVNRIDEAIFMARADALTSPDQEPDYVSSGYEAIWGQSLAGIEARYEDGFFGTVHPEDRGEYRAFVEGVVDDVYAGTADDRYSLEYRIERPDGTERWVHSDCYPIAWEGGPPRVVIVSRDVTDRKAHERRIGSFEAATDGLATADTPAEATRTAVDAAVDALELPAVGAFLYDDTDGVLEPAVESGGLPGAVTGTSVRPGEGPLWEAFAAGRVVAPGDGVASTDDGASGGSTPGLSALADWRVLALGNHGVLLVGAMDEPLDAKTIDAAHVLAATLEAALNHLQGEQRLAAQEAELRSQTERAERLDRIARLTRQVEAAITDASTAREVEHAVCERLASAGPYELAWVGGLEAGADTLTARAVVGGTGRYVDSLGLETTGESADPHPAVRAWQTDAVQVTDSIVDAGPAGDWRQRALAAGYQSICAVPITYDGITHGVLSVATDRPNAFGDREQGVLAQLGTSIANAVVAIERRRALESDETVQLEFTGRGEALSFARAAAAADCRVTLERTVARQDGDVSVYYRFDRGVPENVAAIASDELDGAVSVVASESSSTLVEVRADDWFGSPLAEYGGVLRAASADADSVTVVVEVPQQADVRSFVERLQAIAPSLELVARRQHNQESVAPGALAERVREELTDRQLEVLQTALAAGYFEWPRENDGNAVADRLDITQPTLNKHLRLAERQVFELLLDD